MIVWNKLSLICLSLALVMSVSIASAQQAEPDTAEITNTVPVRRDTPPYEDKLHRVAEIVGALQYLSNLCDSSTTKNFRSRMQQVIDAETSNEPARRSYLVAEYNKGYRAFASVYVSCTPSANKIMTDYLTEGKALVEELVTRYAN